MTHILATEGTYPFITLPLAEYPVVIVVKSKGKSKEPKRVNNFGMRNTEVRSQNPEFRRTVKRTHDEKVGFSGADTAPF